MAQIWSYTFYMQLDKYEVHLNIEVWNEQRDHCGFASKLVRLPFQPYPNMVIKFHVAEVCFESVVWDMAAKAFDATAKIVAGLKQDQYLDLHYYLDEFRRDDWNIIHPRERHWSC